MNSAVSSLILIDLFLKSAMVVTAAAAIAWLGRRASAANRHVIWLSAMIVLLLLPLTKLIAPQWRLSWESQVAPVEPKPVQVMVTRTAPVTMERVLAPSANVAAVPERPIDWRALVVGAWLGGASLILLHRLVVRGWLALLARSGTLISESELPSEDAVGLKGIEVRESNRCRVPMAVGIWKPLVLLPQGARTWSADRLTAALRHERGHIIRRDCLSRALLDVACALYWMNPLVWFAASAMRVAQEQACDDLALRSGTDAAGYAEQLVEAVRELRVGDPLGRHALAMAQPSTLEQRVRAIVDGGRNRSAVTSGVSRTAGFVVALTLGLCAVAQISAAEKETAKDSSAPQIMISAKFIECAPEVAARIRQAAGTPPASSAGSGILNVGQVEVLMKAVNSTAGVDVLAAPRITTLSGQDAQIAITREMRFPTGWERIGGEWKPKAFDTKNVGIMMDVRACIREQGALDVTLEPSVTELEGFTDLDADNRPVAPAKDEKDGLWADAPAGHRVQPIFAKRKMKTEMTLSPGQTVLMELAASQGAAGKKLFVLSKVDVVSPKPKTAAITITSDELQFNSDTGTASAKGDVRVETQDAIIVAQQAEITPRKDGASGAAASATAMDRAEKIILPKIEFQDATLREVVGYFAAKSRELDPAKQGVNVALKIPETDTTTITLSLENVPLSEALKYVAELAGLEVESGPDAVLLREKNAPAAMVEPAAGTPAAQLLARARGIVLPVVEFKEASLAEAVEFVRRKSRDLDLEKKAVNIVIVPGAKPTDVKLTLNVTKITVAELLKYIAQLANHRLEVTPSAFVLRPAE